jgi:hypothetical protein
MLVVAGGLFRHNVNYIHHFYERVHFIPSIIFDTLLGFVIGYILVGVYILYKKNKTLT